MTTTDTNEALTYAQGIADDLRNLEAALEVYEGDDDRDPFSTWLDDALEINTLRGSGVYRVEVVVTVGGPYAVVVRDSRDGEQVEVVVTWWGESARVRAWVPRVAEQLDEIGLGY